MKRHTLAMAVTVEFLIHLAQRAELARGIARAARLLRELDAETADRLLREALDDTET